MWLKTMRNIESAVRFARSIIGYEVKVMDPIKTRIITNDEEASLYDGTFIIETVVPLVAGPEFKTYRLSRDELEDFLNYYHEYAEYVVGIRRDEQA